MNILLKTLLISLLFGVAVNAQNLPSKDFDENEVIPFAIVPSPPLAPGCKDKACTSRYIQHHVERTFKVKEGEKGKSSKIRITIAFIIDIYGNPVNIAASGGSETLNQTAIEVIADLPKFKPGLKDGKPINVSYILPVQISN